MMRRTTGFAVRLAALATALVVGPAALAPGTAQAPAPAPSALAGEGTTAAQKYGWRTMQWDFAWEFGESLDSRPYRGVDIGAGRWEAWDNGTGRVVKYGGGIEFHSGFIRNKTDEPDRGTTVLTLRGQASRRGRWEIRERAERLQASGEPYDFVMELVPADTQGNDCAAHSVTIAHVSPGDGSVRVGVDAGTTSWTRTFTGYPQQNDNYAFALQITRRRITWFINGRAIASLGARAARPKVPMTIRLSLVGDGTKEMGKSIVKSDWVRHYDLNKGKRPPRGALLAKRPSPGC